MTGYEIIVANVVALVLSLLVRFGIDVTPTAQKDITTGALALTNLVLGILGVVTGDPEVAAQAVTGGLG